MKNQLATYTLSKQDEQLRVDLVLHNAFPERSRTYFQYLLDKGNITFKGAALKKREKLQSGDSLSILFEDKHPINTSAENIPLDILFEDEHFVVINKPKGRVVHPAPGHPNQTLVNALVYHFQELEDQEHIRFGLVHRLDKDTSGVMVIAKHEKAHEALSDAFKERRVNKTYLALCLGNPGTKTIQNFLGRDLKDRKKFAVKESGKEAISSIETLAFNKGYSLVKISPQTGRTHQIRVHMHSLGCFIIGDPLYGSAKVNKEMQLKEQMLHAYSLNFIHPFSQDELTFIAPLREDMKQLLSALIPNAHEATPKYKKPLGLPKGFHILFDQYKLRLIGNKD